MADIRSIGGSNLPQVAAPSRTEAVRAAQRAFFQAALNGTAASPVVQPKAASAAATPVQRTTTAAPDRILRPGSLLDIKV